MLQNRRQFIKKILSYGAYGYTMINSMVKHSFAQNFNLAERNNNNFKSQTYEQTLQALFADAELIDSPKIKFSRLPYIAENGAAVPISITSTIENVSKISILVEQNPHPLIAEFHLSPKMIPTVSARMKMAKTSKVIVIVEANGKYYRKAQKVKVTIGGCS